MSAGRTKETEVRDFIQRKVRAAIADRMLYESNADTSAFLKNNVASLANGIAAEITSGYSFIELADIMEWKTRRARR